MVHLISAAPVISKNVTTSPQALSADISNPDRNEGHITSVTSVRLGQVKIITDKSQSQVGNAIVYTVTFNPAIDYVVHTGG